MSVAPSDEPDRVRRITSTLFAGQAGWLVELANSRVELTVGADGRDDCAVYRVRGDLDLVAGSDYVRGPKFTLYELGLMSLYDLGYYLAAANLSDIAAMGAVPIGLLTVVRYPPDMADDEFEQVLQGIRDACDPHGVLNVGGDIGTAERLILSAAALGICPPGAALTRAGARPGDALILSGPTGIAGAAMAYFPQRASRGWTLAPSVEERLLNAWRRPRAQIALGAYLATAGLASACQDTSDGLRATVEQLAAASGVGITVDQEKLPLDPAVTAVANLLGHDPLTLVFGGSVDFRLLYTVRPDSLDELLASDHRHGVRVIGSVNDTNRVALRHRDGTLGELPGVAFRHRPDDHGPNRPDPLGTNNPR